VEDNAHAGQGAVVLDIGGDVGALVIIAPAALLGVEIEARPVGGPVHHHGPGPDHVHLAHVAVLARRVRDGRVVHSGVFAGLRAGRYEMYERPAGPVRLTVPVTGGAVTDAVWP
jgi:hypothetical protein